MRSLATISLCTATLGLALYANDAQAQVYTETTASPRPPSREISYREEVRPNRTLLMGGGGLFLGTYAVSAVVGAVNDNSADRKLLIPIVGPWLDLGDRRCDQAQCDNEDLSKALLITSGILQGVGFVTAVVGLLVPEYQRTATTTVSKPRTVISPAPMGHGGMGLSAVAVF